MKRELKRLQPKHHVILRLAFRGWSNTRIAAHLGIRRETVSRILHSPLARAEMTRMQAGADALVVDVPFRVWLLRKLNRAASTEDAIELANSKRKGGRRSASALEELGSPFLTKPS